MKYVGGKFRIAKYLSPIVLSTRPKIVIEPFCGALNMTSRLLKDDPDLIVYAYDVHKDLIDMWKAVQDGWEPPVAMTREEYNALRSSEPSPLRTFAGYGCSFAGKWFGGYAEHGSRDYVREARNSVMRRKPYLNRVKLSHASYETLPPPPLNSVIYCDPPYAGTLKPGARGEFDHDTFWRWAQSQTVPCYVSEYSAPDGVESVWSREVRTDMNTKEGKGVRLEKLYLTGSLDGIKVTE